MHVPVIEGNPDLAADVCDYLEANGHGSDAAGYGITGRHLAVTHDYDAIVLDIILPGMDGFTVCRRLRQEAWRDTPVLTLTARDSLDDQVAGLELGADDDLLKPFALRELEARLKALARRAHGAAASAVLRVADLEFDPALTQVRRGRRILVLTPIPMNLLETLMLASPHVVRREQLERSVSGDRPPDSDALRAHVQVLRNAVDALQPQPALPYRQPLRGDGWCQQPDSRPGPVRRRPRRWRASARRNPRRRDAGPCCAARAQSAAPTPGNRVLVGPRCPGRLRPSGAATGTGDVGHRAGATGASAAASTVCWSPRRAAAATTCATTRTCCWKGRRAWFCSWPSSSPEWPCSPVASPCG